MRCDLHCPPAGSALAAPLRALAALAVVAGCGWAVTALVPVWAAMVLAEAAAAAVLVWAVQRRVRYWGWRKPVRTDVRTEMPRARVRAQIGAPPKAIGGRPVVTATVLASDERAVR